ncbi:energy transducer TonB family protein [Campylobacter troglodytis]|uniref:energy transducer TonB family protein n=1 Tax=Campylobacter troglodytis TaxID=654363 RepID=UPI0011587055|nr:energy transducer TonB [Campylobacter troglodytis]TQR53098.1 hypothetical protein DMC01_12050 [Campylobacter troglodytis]
MRSHKFKAFILTCCIFVAPLFALIALGDVFKAEIKGEESMSLVMGQFIAQGQVVAPKLAPAPPTPREHKRHEKHKKHHKKERIKEVKKGKEKEEQRQEESSVSGGAQVANNAPMQIGTLAYGKTDNPFLREIKAAIDRAARETYPHQAIKMRLTGEVLLEFVWLNTKKLQAAKIIKSSGYKLLDDNVMKVLVRAANEFPAYKENIRIQIPVVYNIKQH